MTIQTVRYRRSWTPPAFYTKFERREDGKMFQVRQLSNDLDQQVCLVSLTDSERHWPTMSMLASDYREMP